MIVQRTAWSVVNEQRERLACAAAAVLLVAVAWRTTAAWQVRAAVGPPSAVLPAEAALPIAPFVAVPFHQLWSGAARDPFQAGGPAPAQDDVTALPAPPLPPLEIAPPPADPWPSLYRRRVVRPQAHLLTLIAEPQPPTLKTGKECVIQPRPHDIVQAKGDPEPIPGSIHREDGGRIWFYFNKPRGMGHPRNPLVIADLLVLKRKTTTVQEACRERSRDAAADPAAHVALARDCIDCELLDEAAAALRKAAEVEPKHGAAYVLLADLCLSRGDRDGEVGALQAAVEAGAASPAVRLRLARCCFEYDLLGLAHQHCAAGFEAATEATLDAVAKGETVAPTAQVAQSLLRLAAEARLLDGRGAEADRLLRALAATAPDDPAVRNAQALSHLMAGRVEPAAALLRQVAEATEPPASALNNLGAVLFQQGDYAEALARFQACRAAAPGHTKAAANAVLALATLGRLDDADKLLATIEDRPTACVAWHLAVGYLHERAGRVDEAVAAYRSVLDIDRSVLDSLCGLARCHLRQGDAEAAAKRFAQARLLRPADPGVLRGLATSLYLRGRFAEAAEALGPLAGEQAEARDLVRLAIASLRVAGRRRDAAALLDRALVAAPVPEPYALAAKAYAAHAGLAGSRERAEELFREAQAATDVPEVARYAADAIRRIFVARGEEFTTLTFQGEDTPRLPEGWAAAGSGVPAPVIRGNVLCFQGQPTASVLRRVARGVALSAPGEGGAPRLFSRFEARVAVPMTNQAAVGISLGVGETRFQVALRTILEPQPSRRLAWRVLRGEEAGPWSDLPGLVAAERFALGIAVGDGAVDVFRNGRAVGRQIPFPELAGAADSIELGLFAAPDAGQQCLYTVREVELVWKKPPGER